MPIATEIPADAFNGEVILSKDLFMYPYEYRCGDCGVESFLHICEPTFTFDEDEEDFIT